MHVNSRKLRTRLSMKESTGANTMYYFIELGILLPDSHRNVTENN